MEYGGYRWRRVEVGKKWHWMEDYVMLTATYVLVSPSDRRVEFGTGMFVFGEPRGSRGKFSGEREVTTYGGGAIHVRLADNGGPCLVGLAQKSYKLVTIASGSETQVQPIWVDLMDLYARAHKEAADWLKS
jgi:hypothetical protein